jgi:AP-2 complex subunit alpha
MQQMLERPTPLSIDATLLLLRGLNFGVEHLYLDPSPNNEAGAAYFICGQPGAEQALLCQVGLCCPVVHSVLHLL